MRKLRGNKAQIKTEMHKSQSLFRQSAGVISAGVTQTRFNRNANMRFQDAMQGENSQPPNRLLKNAKQINLDFNQQSFSSSTIRLQSNNIINLHLVQRLAAVGTFLVPVPFGSNHIPTAGQSSSINNPNVNKGYCGGCKYVFYCPRCPCYF